MSLPPHQRCAYLVGPEAIELRTIPVEAPRAGELLVQIGAATTCGTDVKVFRRGGHPRMLKVPTPFGHEVAGTVAAIGDGVSDWRVGDRVVVLNSAPCGNCEFCEIGRENLCHDLVYLNGAFAEYLTVPPRFVLRNTHAISDSLPFEMAALTEPLACVLHGIDACRLTGSTEAVVYGAGPIGLLFVAALSFSGHRVVLADPNPSRLEVGRLMGAEETVEIERGGGQEERVRRRAITGDQSGAPGFPLVIEATGVPEVWRDAMATVRTGGTVNFFGGCAPGSKVTLDTKTIHYSELTLLGVYHHRPDTARRALRMLGEERFPVRRLLSDAVPLEQVEAALRSMMAKTTLKVVVRP